MSDIVVEYRITGGPEAKRTLQELAAAATRAGTIIDAGMRKASRGTLFLNGAIDTANNKMHSLANKAGILGGGLSRIGPVGSAAAAGLSLLADGAVALVTQSFAVNREFGKLEASLKTVSGSSGEAKKSMAWLEQFATDTPYQLSGVVSAFVKLKSHGLDTSEEALKSYGNTASALGEDLGDMIDAVVGASSGNFDELERFGVSANEQGEKVTLTFQGMSTTIGNNAQEIQKYLQGIGDVNFAGAMSEQMTTLDGQVATLEGSWTRFLRVIGDSGLNAASGASISWLSSTLDTISNWATDLRDIENLQLVDLERQRTDVEKRIGEITIKIEEFKEPGKKHHLSQLGAQNKDIKHLNESTKQLADINKQIEKISPKKSETPPSSTTGSSASATPTGTPLEPTAQEKAAREKAAREKAEREKAEREKAARERAARERAEQDRVQRTRIDAIVGEQNPVATATASLQALTALKKLTNGTAESDALNTAVAAAEKELEIATLMAGNFADGMKAAKMKAASPEPTPAERGGAAYQAQVEQKKADDQRLAALANEQQTNIERSTAALEDLKQLQARLGDTSQPEALKNAIAATSQELRNATLMAGDFFDGWTAAYEGVGESAESAADIGKRAFEMVSQSAQNGIADLLYNMELSVGGLVDTVHRALAQMVAEQITSGLVNPALTFLGNWARDSVSEYWETTSTAEADGGLIGSFANGGFSYGTGYVTGPGGPRDDVINARLSNGEFVVNAAATKRWLPLLHAINRPRGYADGGPIGPAAGSYGGPMAGSGADSVAVNINIYGGGKNGQPEVNDRQNGSQRDIDVMMDGIISRQVRPGTQTFAALKSYGLSLPLAKR
jgi:hypothetical protein